MSRGGSAAADEGAGGSRPPGAAEERRPFLVGVVSDTHGRLPDAVLDAFAGVDAIVHAGDIVDEATLLALETIAPVTAVRGNCDAGGRTGMLPWLANVALGGVRFAVVHRLADLRGQLDPADAGIGVVVSGHSHRASVVRDREVLYVNPGSASQGRGNPRSVAIVTVERGRAEARLVELG